MNYFNKVNSQKNHETSALHPVEQSSGIFTRKQEIIIMPNNSTKNNNNNSNKQLKDTLPQTSVTTTSQQQQQQQQQSQLSTVYAKEKSNSINVHFRQNISDNKPKCVDVRRTTPRQLKQYQSKRGHLFSSTSPPTSTTTNLTESDQKALFNHAISEKSKTTGNFHSTGGKSAHAQHQTHPGDIASSLIRTASLHLKTTLSRLKRSNSGHTSKSLDNSMHTTTTTTNTTTISNTNKTTTADDETSLRRSSMPYDQKSIKSITKYYERQSSNDGDDLSPGCTKWSTRLGPPPPCTLSTPIVASSIHRNTCPKCTASMVTYATTITTVSAGTRAPVSENKDPSLSHPYTSTTTTTTTTNVSSAFYSLPTCESNEISLLADDCIDFGTLGRINFRTGSFMGRYPNYSRSNQLQQYSRGQNISHIQHHQQQQPQPQRLADYRPLYLSVQPQTSSSSGNTTRSAPSPSLSSITSTQGVLVLSSSSPGGSCHHQESSYQHQQNKPVALKTSSTSSITLAGSSSRSSRNYSLHYPQTGDSSGVVIGDRGVEDYSIPVQHEDILSASRRNPNRELDPILARLLSDVTSIDEYRSSLQPHGSITPPSTSSSSIHRKRNTAAHQKHSPMLTAASSDPDSISRSAENLSIQQNIMDDIWDLNKQIGDLIQMEFHYKQRKPTTTSTTTTTPKTVSAMKKYQSSPHGTLLSGSRSSAPK
ncbi:unnamed protein product [Trichobilharzia regenti]|nr:unnamed protein product [Trichobilharzia regenti]